MLDFFRKYQRHFFLVITVVVIFSFTFFGAYSTFVPTEGRKDTVVGRTIHGSQMMLSEVQQLSRFIATDREDAMQGRGMPPNLCNDGVIRYDFLKDRLGELLVSEYFDVLKGDLASRLDKAKRFKPYAHPDAPALSAKAVWEHLAPEINAEITALQAETEVTPAIFNHLAKLLQWQSRLHPEMLRRILVYQHQQYPWLTIDQKLSYEDLSLFGFHSATDWFGRDFVDIVAQFILNAAAAAEEKGYRVSLEEAKGELIHHFQESMEKLAEAKANPELNFHNHLRVLGFDERSASEVWRKVLLFRRYFQDVGETAFVDKLPYRDFAEYTKETVTVQKYQWATQIQTAQDLAELQTYIKAVAPKADPLPSSFLSVAEVEKKHPELVQSTYRAQVAEVAKKQVALKATIKQVWQWQTDDANWSKLRKEFSLAQAETREERFKVLEKLDGKTRAAVDAFARESLVDENPGWIEEALAATPKKEKTWSVSGNDDPTLKSKDTFYSVENIEKIEEKHILPFAKARRVLAEMVGKASGEYTKEKNPFFLASKEALKALQKNPADPKWIQTGADPLLDQFKLEKKEQAISRTSKEDWMKEQAFLMLPDLWSPIHVAEDGQIVFFYLQEKKSTPGPVLDQLVLGKETLAADAKLYFAERLLQTVKKKHAIVIPVQKEDE